jgi:diacylglycerol kinase family enzyme
VPVDAVRLAGDGLACNGMACNAVVLGVPPDRLRWASPARSVEIEVDGQPWFAGSATTVVIANGQFLRGADIVPRGHPGDGRLEVQVYELRPRERRAMRRRLTTGAHVPHPRIRSRTARVVELRAARPVAFEADGVSGAAVATVRAEVVPAAFRLLL